MCKSRVVYYKSNEPLLAQFSSSLFWCRDEERPAIAAVDIRNESLQAGVVERLVFTSQGMVRADVGSSPSDCYTLELSYFERKVEVASAAPKASQPK
jgi:hypothetical protein